MFGIVILFAGAYLSYSADGVSFWSESVVSNTSDVIITPSDSTSNNISSTYLDDENADETEEFFDDDEDL